MKILGQIILFLAVSLLFTACSKEEGSGNETNNQNTTNTRDESSEEETTNDSLNPSDDSEEDIMSDFSAKVQSFMNNNAIKGGQIAITRNEKLVYFESFGDSDSENEVTDLSLFRIASVSKPITLVAISKLNAENKIKLSDQVFGENGVLGTKYGTPPYQEGIEEITIDQLVEHTSGFRNEPFDIMFDEVSLTHKDLIDKVLDEIEYKRNPSYYYSNFGYCLLGRIVEEVTGIDYEEYVKEEILAPMGIEKMVVGGNTFEERFENEVTYYSSWFDPYGMNVTRMDSHGGWIASAKDLALFGVHTDTRYGVNDLLDIGEAKSYMENGNYVHYGALPGTISVISVSSSLTYPYCYAAVFNSGNSNYESVLDAFSSLISEEIVYRTDWPSVDLFED